MYKYLLLIGLVSICNADEIYKCRDVKVKHAFDILQHYPYGRKGYVVDHICPLMWGGIDDISNMQYQTITMGHLKDKVESTLVGKTIYCNNKNSTSERLVFNCKNGETALQAKNRVTTKEPD